MANLYVSLAGSNTAPYETWAKAANSIITASTAASAGDTIYVNTGTYTGTSFNINPSSTLANPVSIIGTNDTANEPPQTLAAIGAVNLNITSGTGDVFLLGYINVIRLGFQTSTSTGSKISVNAGTIAQRQRYLNCKFTSASSNSVTSWLSLGDGARENTTITEGCEFEFPPRTLSASTSSGRIGGSWTSTGDTFTNNGLGATMRLFMMETGVYNFHGTSFGAVGAGGFNFTTVAGGGEGVVRLDRCKMSATGSLFDSSLLNSLDISSTDSDPSGVVGSSYHTDSFGNSTSNAAGIPAPTGATTDGSTKTSVLMSGTAATKPHPYAGELMYAYSDGTAQNYRIELLFPTGTTPDNSMASVEFIYQDTVGSSESVVIHDVNIIGAATVFAASAFSSGDWGTAGVPVVIDSGIVTPKVDTFVSARVRLYDAIDVYVSPKIYKV